LQRKRSYKESLAYEKGPTTSSSGRGEKPTPRYGTKDRQSVFYDGRNRRSKNKGGKELRGTGTQGASSKGLRGCR